MVQRIIKDTRELDATPRWVISSTLSNGLHPWNRTFYMQLHPSGLTDTASTQSVLHVACPKAD